MIFGLSSSHPFTFFSAQSFSCIISQSTVCIISPSIRYLGDIKRYWYKSLIDVYLLSFKLKNEAYERVLKYTDLSLKPLIWALISLFPSSLFQCRSTTAIQRLWDTDCVLRGQTARRRTGLRTQREKEKPVRPSSEAWLPGLSTMSRYRRTTP